jgi:N-acetylmuramic acid 6-phosphate etherase
MNADAFLAISADFRLGDLPTEQPHPLTTGMAELARSDLAAAIQRFHQVDLQAMQTLQGQLGPLADLAEDMRACLHAGNRIFLAGCGATGRLSLALETILRQQPQTAAAAASICGFMAGGDAALIRSIEAFEDCPAYAVRQMDELGFAAGDLLVAITEGGETPFVIGACLEAATRSERRPWFLYCNPRAVLLPFARCRSVLQHPRVRCFELAIGPMALSGSTRLQASTVQMLVTGAALLDACGLAGARDTVQRFHDLLQAHDPLPLANFIAAEARCLAAAELVLYQTNDYGISVLTDTTERSPTFSLPPFENRGAAEEPCSPVYLRIPSMPDAAAAWQHLLGRQPRPLEWPETHHRTGLSRMLGYDISAAAIAWREQRHGKTQHLFTIDGPGPCLHFHEHHLHLNAAAEAPLLRHLLLKVSLNLHSTLLMALAGRYDSNLMTQVYPGNNKLIDRAARYLQNRHFQQLHTTLPYEAAVRQVIAGLGAK